MNEHETKPSRSPFHWRTLIVALAAWTLYAVLMANFISFSRELNEAPNIPFIRLLRYNLPEAWLWAVLTLFILEAARRFPVTAGTWKRRVPLHLLLAVGFHAVAVVLMDLLYPLVRGVGPRPPVASILVGGLIFNLFIYAAIVATWHAVVAHSRELKLRNDLLEAELRTLRMQLQPHFLFNTLNTVSELIHRDPDRAERAVARLGDLLRWSLRTSTLDEVALGEELEALGLYLDIQRLRHGEDVTLRIVAEPDVLSCRVPSLLLQPLVENAIRHGIAQRGKGTVTIGARSENGRLVLRVADDGAGVSGRVEEGTGLRTTRTRLWKLYGDDHALRLVPAGGGGTVVEIEVPERRHVAAERVPA